MNEEYLAACLAELLGQDTQLSYGLNYRPGQPPQQVSVEHKVQPWIDLIFIINNGKFKIAKPKVSRMHQYNYASHDIKKHYITLAASISYKGKKINLHNPEDLDFKFDFTAHSPPHRRTPNILNTVKCGRINDHIVRTKVYDYIYDICQPNLTNFADAYKKAWQDAINNAEQIINAHFAIIGDERRAKLRENLAKFLKNSDFIEMDEQLILTLFRQTYQSLELFASFIHKNRQDAEMATLEDIETAQELAKVMQVQDA
jgi:hypothetical protein